MAETREYTVYTYDELSEDAKEAARQDYEMTFDYPWTRDAMESLEAFCDHFGVSLEDYQYSLSQWGGRGDHITIDIGYDLEALDELEGVHAIDNAEDGDTYETLRDNLAQAVETMQGDSLWTGYIMDCALVDAFQEALDLESLNIQKAFDDVGHAFLKYIREDIAHLVSEEAFAETSEANEWTYLENGEFAL